MYRNHIVLVYNNPGIIVRVERTKCTDHKTVAIVCPDLELAGDVLVRQIRVEGVQGEDGRPSAQVQNFQLFVLHWKRSFNELGKHFVPN